MESETESRGRFKVTVAPPPETSVGRFRLIPQGSPFLQRGRFSVIPEEETGSPLTQTKLSGPKIVVDHSPEWDFVSISDSHDRLICKAYLVMRIESFLFRLRCDIKQESYFHSTFRDRSDSSLSPAISQLGSRFYRQLRVVVPLKQSQNSDFTPLVKFRDRRLSRSPNRFK